MKDYHMQTIAAWDIYKLPVPVDSPTGPLTHAWLPVDEWGHALDAHTIEGGKAQDLTSPYGSLTYAIGSADDFHCFDHDYVFGFAFNGEPGSEPGIGPLVPLHLVALHSVLNCETASFIQDASYDLAPMADAVATAQSMADEACEWLTESMSITRHDQKGWNQDETFWVRQVAHTVGYETIGDILERRIIRNVPARHGWPNRVTAPAIFPAPAVRDHAAEDARRTSITEPEDLP